MTNEPYLVTTDQDKDIVTALHSICFGQTEWAKLQAALDDENCFALLAGCDEDGQPAGYLVVRVQDKEAHGLWLGVRPDRRGEGWAHKLSFAAINEARARGAEIYDSHVAEDNDTSDVTLHLHKKLGFVLVDSNLDWTIRDGKRHEFTNHRVQASLMTGK